VIEPNETIAIDGPPASGKTTVGRALARRLGYRFLDTGILYRALTWCLLQTGTDLADPLAIARAAKEVSLTLRPTTKASWSVCVQERELSEAELRSPQVDAAVSQVSSVPEVREQLRGLQRALAKAGHVIMAGQDIGSVVLPDAPVKVYLEASLEERVRRRSRQSGKAAEIGASLARRSSLDAARAVSPLAPARDAHVINTDAFTVEQVVTQIIAIIRQSDS